VGVWLVAVSACQGKPLDLHKAVEAGDRDGLVRALEAGPPERLESEVGGETPLGVAIRADRPDMAEVLLARGANPNTLLRQGDAPVQAVVERAVGRLNPLDVKRMMPAARPTAEAIRAIDQGTAAWVGVLAGGKVALQVDVEGAYGTALQRAAADALPLTVQALVRAGARPDLARVRDGLTVLEIAAGAGQAEVVDVLLAEGVQPPAAPCPAVTVVAGERFRLATGAAAAFARVRAAFPEARRTVAGQAATRNALCEAPLEVAVLEGRIEAIATLASEIDADAARRAFARAIQLGSDETVAALIAAGVRPEAAHLGLAAREGRTETVRKLLLQGLPADGETAGPTPLCEAAAGGHEAVVTQLLAAGASAMGRADMPTVLCAARAPFVAGHGSDPAIAILERLVAAGAELRATDTTGETALHVAARAGREALCLWLVSRGLDPETPSTGPYRVSARTLAEQAGHDTLARRLAAAKPAATQP
jgi:ankyrin repeat protein